MLLSYIELRAYANRRLCDPSRSRPLCRADSTIRLSIYVGNIILPLMYPLFPLQLVWPRTTGLPKPRLSAPPSVDLTGPFLSCSRNSARRDKARLLKAQGSNGTFSPDLHLTSWSLEISVKPVA